MQTGKIPYDRASIIFSPKGRLFQVEYARGAVEKGTTIIGLKYNDGVALIVDKHITSTLVKPDSIEKISQIDDHIGCAISGLVADARKLVDRARLLAEINKVTYNEIIPVKSLVKQICEYKHVHTQFATVRPFGVAMLIAGVDDTGKYLFATEPSGVFMEYKATSEGSGRKEAVGFFEQNYNVDLSVGDAISLGVKALHKGSKGKLNLNAIEIAIVDTEKRFHKLSPDEWKKYVKEAFE
jgi:proteasome alpha subunit